MKPVVIGLVWDEDDDLKHSVVNGLVPKGRTADYWYSPNPSIEELEEVSEYQDSVSGEGDRLKGLMAKGDPEEVQEYLEAVRRYVAYPFHWELLKIRLPIQEIFNTKIGSQGENLQNRVQFQIMDALLGLYGKLPGFSIVDLVVKVNQIYKFPTTVEGYPTYAWNCAVEKMIADLDEGALFRSFKSRLRNAEHEYNLAVQEQYDDAEVGEDNALMDKLSKQLVVLVSDVDTQEEAEYIQSLPNGILIGVGDGEWSSESFDAHIPVPDEHPVFHVRKVIHETMQSKL